MKKTIATIFNRAKTKNKGFTLIELLAVIVILAIVLVVTIPSVINSMNSAKKSQLENAAKSVADWLTKQYELANLGGGVSSASPEYTSFVSAYGEYPNSYYAAASFDRNLASCNDESLSMLKAAGISKPDANIDLDNSYVWKNENKIAVAISAKDGGSFYTSGGENIVSVNSGNIALQIIPAEYQVADYIEGNNSGYIPTDIYLNGSDTVKIKMKTLDTDSTNCCIFGSYTSGTSNNFSLYSAGASNLAYWRYGASLYQAQKFENNTLYEIEINYNSIKVNETTYSPGFTESTFTTSNPIYIGHIYGSNYAKLRGQLYSFKVGEKAKFIPCKRISDGAVGMYETVSQKFYPAVGELKIKL